MTISLSSLLEISTRTKEYQNTSQSTTQSIQSQQLQNGVQSLPRISTPLKQDNILTNSSPSPRLANRYGSTVGTFAKSIGQDHNNESPLKSIAPHAKQYLGVARSKLMTPEQQETLSPAHINSSLNDYLMRFLRSQFGRPFRQTFARRFCAVVLGTPYSGLGLILHAIDSLTSLAVASTEADQFGIVSQDIPTVIRVFVNTITDIETLNKAFEIHWTDVEFSERGGEGRRVLEIEILVGRLKSGLKELINAFEGFAKDLGLTRTEIRIARQVAGLDVQQ